MDANGREFGLGPICGNSRERGQLWCCSDCSPTGFGVPPNTPLPSRSANRTERRAIDSMKINGRQSTRKRGARRPTRRPGRSRSPEHCGSLGVDPLELSRNYNNSDREVVGLTAIPNGLDSEHWRPFASIRGLSFSGNFRPRLMQVVDFHDFSRFFSIVADISYVVLQKGKLRLADGQKILRFDALVRRCAC
jgi:hypothetical protein